MDFGNKAGTDGTHINAFSNKKRHVYVTDRWGSPYS